MCTPHSLTQLSDASALVCKTGIRTWTVRSNVTEPKKTWPAELLHGRPGQRWSPGGWRAWGRTLRLPCSGHRVCTRFHRFWEQVVTSFSLMPVARCDYSVRGTASIGNSQLMVRHSSAIFSCKSLSWPHFYIFYTDWVVCVWFFDWNHALLLRWYPYCPQKWSCYFAPNLLKR